MNCMCPGCKARRAALPDTVFQAQLAFAGACWPGRKWVGGKTAREAYLTCNETAWLVWLVRHFAGAHFDALSFHSPDAFRRAVPWPKVQEMARSHWGRPGPFRRERSL